MPPAIRLPSRPAIRRAGTLVLAAWLSACGIGPLYRRPALDMPSTFTAARFTGPIFTPAAPPPSAGWWMGFGAPQLDALIAQAELSSPDAAAAAARVIQADQAARIAGSPLLPNFGATATQSWQRAGTGSQSSGQNQALLNALGLGGGGRSGGGSRYSESRSYSAELSASYEVDFWGKNLDALRAAQAAALASRYDQQTVWLTVVSSIATTYFQAIGYRDRLAIARHNLGDALQVLDAYRARLQVGTANALDVSQQEALVAGYRAQLPALESQFRQETIALAILVGVPPERLELGPTTLTRLTLPPVAAGMPADVLRRRPDVANAEALLISQNQTVRQDVANFFPSLTLTAGGGLSSLALSAITGPGTLVANFMSQLTQTIFDNGLKSGTLGEAKGRYQELAADYVKAVLQALSDVETSLTQVGFSAEQERLEAEAVRTAQRSADIARAQLAAGTVDIITVLSTETTLFSDQDALAQVRVSRFLALVSLYKALGGGWESAGALPQTPSCAARCRVTGPAPPDLHSSREPGSGGGGSPELTSASEHHA